MTAVSLRHARSTAVLLVTLAAFTDILAYSVAVPVLPDDTVKTLAARVFAAECEAYPAAIAMHWQFLNGR